MAWSKVGSIKGPQGDPGQDAQLPSGGTEGQVLTKTASGSEWQDAQTIDTPVPISQGGTGATTAEGARTALGIPDIEVATDEEFDSYMGLS